VPDFVITEEFLRGGLADFSVTDPAGFRHTFRVAHKPASGGYPEAWFVHVQAGSDRRRYLGKISVPGRPLRFWATAKTPSDDEAAAALKALDKALDAAAGRTPFPGGWSANHLGRCARCRKPLKTEESCRIGLGPACRQRG
jgi:hypothetical protein